ncbi:hypothetical protein GGX14DRAFT_603265 [Mycena pura]|uniref:Uncharacterized protein n=1 Tax=Mycena pura TaxID=153505 RepID=A0AAD6Y469_9AGAR|nr:hypothetical protein GGX14DRAFT_603265 [Mycena pura]
MAIACYPAGTAPATPRALGLRAVLALLLARAARDAFRPRDGDKFMHLFDMPDETAQRSSGIHETMGWMMQTCAVARRRRRLVNRHPLREDGVRRPAIPVLDALEWTLVTMPWCVLHCVGGRAPWGLRSCARTGYSTATSPRAHAAERARGRARCGYAVRAAWSRERVRTGTRVHGAHSSTPHRRYAPRVDVYALGSVSHPVPCAIPPSRTAFGNPDGRPTAAHQVLDACRRTPRCSRAWRTRPLARIPQEWDCSAGQWDTQHGTSTDIAADLALGAD